MSENHCFNIMLSLDDLPQSFTSGLETPMELWLLSFNQHPHTAFKSTRPGEPPPGQLRRAGGGSKETFSGQNPKIMWLSHMACMQQCASIHELLMPARNTNKCARGFDTHSSLASQEHCLSSLRRSLKKPRSNEASGALTPVFFPP